MIKKSGYLWKCYGFTSELYRCVPEDLKDAPVVLATKSKDKVWLEQIIQNYNNHKKSLPFYSIDKSERVVAPKGP